MRLSVRDLHHSYGGHANELFGGLSFDVDAGESVAIMAPSGRGKSTLLNIIGGLLDPTAGGVLVDGDLVANKKESISWVFQSTNLLGRRSVLDNVLLPARVRGDSTERAMDTAMEAITRVGLSEKAAEPARNLSGGEAQRVGVARALAWPSRVLLADEPTANLDEANARVIAGALYARVTDAAVLVVTHDLSVAERADSVIRL